MEDLALWITYHKDSQIEEYSLKEYDMYHLYKGNDIAVVGANINHLNQFYSELTTFYWVWKNHVFSKVIGFCHYRRIFSQIVELDRGTCQVWKICHLGHSVYQDYKMAHNYNDMYDVISILNEKYGLKNIYTKYLLEGKIFIPCCSFIMCYEDFEKLCEFLFPILFAYDKKNRLYMNPERYRQKAERDFRYDDVDYQQRAIAFLAERLISAFLVLNMNLVSVLYYSQQTKNEK